MVSVMTCKQQLTFGIGLKLTPPLKLGKNMHDIIAPFDYKYSIIQFYGASTLVGQVKKKIIWFR